MAKKLFLTTILTLITISFSIAQELIIIESKNLKCNDSVLVFTPKDFTQQTPTLFLLHGWSGCYKDWSKKHNLQEISNRTNFRIICPDGFYNGWYLNNSNPNEMQWRDFFHNELYPQMKERYNLNPNETFITGLSMGGHGAINLFIDNPTLFKSAGSMSGVLDLELSNLKDSQMSKVVKEKRERITTESAINRLYKLEGINKPIIVTCGYDDVYSKCTEEFSKQCRYLNIPHIIILSPGKHSWQYWGFALEQHIWHFTKILNGENLGY